MSTPRRAEDVPATEERDDAERSIVDLTRALVRARSQTGIDGPGPAMDVLAAWLTERGIEPTVLHSEGEPVAVVATAGDDGPGPVLCLNACIDTAPVGALENWSADPFGADVVDGWMYGRGAADSKAGLAIFAHVLADRRRAGVPHGRLVLVADGDEHTGRFRGIREYTRAIGVPSAALIGYPGLAKIHIGARGFWRARVLVYGTSTHSGSRTAAKSAVTKAAELALALNSLPLKPGRHSAFGVPPRATVTEFVGGAGYTQVPDLCLLRVDVRLTPTFDATRARTSILEAIQAIDERFSYGRATEVHEEESWPAYKLPRTSPLVRALHTAVARELHAKIPFAVAGPSNSGNYFARLGVEALCGFGVAYEGVHARDERIELRSIPAVWRVYRDAVAELLAENGLPAPRGAAGGSGR